MAVQLKLCLALGLAICTSAFAQGTIHISFANLAVGSTLDSQFTASGVHFISTAGRYDYASIIANPGFANAPSGNVALFSNTSRIMGISFDRPVTAISVNAALVRDRESGNASLGFEASSPNIGDGGPYAYGAVSMNEKVWQRASLTFPTPVTLVGLQGVNIYNNLNYGSWIYVSSVDVTFVPEPSSAQLITFTTFSALALFFPKLLRKR
jgi:hypothetical protein